MKILEDLDSLQVKILEAHDLLCTIRIVTYTVRTGVTVNGTC